MAPRNVQESSRTPNRGVRVLRVPCCAVIALWTLLGCGDPVRDRAIAALGSERPGVPTGPLHRPGQPCLLCHSDSGGEEPFLVAGTVYIFRDSAMPIDGVKVNLFDSAGHQFTTSTNCAGNFIVRPGDFALNTPFWVNLQRDDVIREMDTAIYREGSCAGCHSDPAGPAAAGHVFLIDDPTIEKVPVSACH